MSELDIVRTPTVIATEINSIKGQTRALVLHASAEIGKRLTEAKELVPHGEWGNWLKQNVEYSQSTANNLMHLHKEYNSNSSIPTLGNLSYTKALALLGVPEEEREDFVAENDVENMSARELQRVVKEKQKLEKQLADKEAAGEKEKTKLTQKIERLEKQLEEATTNQIGEDQIKELERELQGSKEKVKKLEAELKVKPIEAATVEVVPEALEKELAMLREKVAQQGDPASIKFKIQFESLVAEFRALLAVLREISDEAEREKYKNAVSGLIGKMSENL